MTAPTYTAGYVAALLSGCRDDWIRKYAPAAKLIGGVFYLGNAEGDPGDSVPIPIRPNGKAMVDFAAGPIGDDLDLLARLIGGTLADAYREAIAYLGLGGTTTAPRPKPTPRPVAEPADDNRAAAQAIWREAEPIGGPAVTYLRRHRGIDRWPAERLRFHAACPFGTRTAPAIVAPVNCSCTGHVVGVWRIQLDLAGKLVWRGGLGPSRGNAARLYEAAGEELAVAEGVEDAIALHLCTGLPCWAALSAGNMAALLLPGRFRRITICQDNDQPDERGHRAGQEAAQALARRLIEEGRAATIIRAVGVKDANDVLRRRAGP